MVWAAISFLEKNAKGWKVVLENCINHHRDFCTWVWVSCFLALIKAKSQAAVHCSLAQGGPFKASVSGSNMRQKILVEINQT